MKLKTSKAVDLINWYTEVVTTSQMVDYGLAKGTIVLKPWGLQIWEQIKKNFERYYLSKIKATPILFPTFFPYAALQKEQKHLQGFQPELFHVSDKNVGQANEKGDDYVLRPTSEIQFCHYFQKNLHSYQDLPMVLNQWCSVFRVEKNTRPFLRNSEFWWHETHALFANDFDNAAFVRKMMVYYQQFFHNHLSLATLTGLKSANERFAGAQTTCTNEVILPDGKALQIATSHDLGQTFAKTYQIKYQTANNAYAVPFQASAGFSTRVLGAITMVHGDDFGLVLPFKIAPVQFVIITTNRLEHTNHWQKIQKALQSFRTKIIYLDHQKPQIGKVLNHYETLGVPFQIVIGAKEVSEDSYTLYNRFTRTKNSVQLQNWSKVEWQNLVNSYQNEMYAQSVQLHLKQTVIAHDLTTFEQAINANKVVIACWVGDENAEIALKNQTTATIRCYLKDASDLTAKHGNHCFYTNQPNGQWAYFAKSY